MQVWLNNIAFFHSLVFGSFFFDQGHTKDLDLYKLFARIAFERSYICIEDEQIRELVLFAREDSDGRVRSV